MFELGQKPTIPAPSSMSAPCHKRTYWMTDWPLLLAASRTHPLGDCFVPRLILEIQFASWFGPAPRALAVLPCLLSPPVVDWHPTTPQLSRVRVGASVQRRQAVFA